MSAPDTVGGNSSDIPPPPDEGHPQLPVNYNFAHPAFFSAAIWDGTRFVLDKGHNTVAPEMPAGDVNANFEDDTDAYMAGFAELAWKTNGRGYESLEEAIASLTRLHLVAESRSADPVLRARQRLIDMGCVDKILRTTIFSSALAYGMGLGVSGARYTPAYERVLPSLSRQPSGLRIMSPDVARIFFLNDLEDGDSKIDEALACLQDQRDVQQDETPLKKITMVEESPVTLVIGDFDIVHNPDTQIKIASKHGIGIERIPTGHLPQVSRPLETANFLKELSVRALLRKPN